MAGRWLLVLVERARALLTPGRFDSELDEEIRYHIAEATERNLRRGLSPGEARRVALRDFGGVERVKDDVRSATGIRLLHDLVQDLSYALRTFRRNPGFASVAVMTIGVCIAANAAVFSVVHSVLLQPLPFPEPDRLVSIFNSYPGAANPRSYNSAPDLNDRREAVSGLEDVALYTASTYSVGDQDGSRRVSALLVTPSFFPVLRAAPALGRGFAPASEAGEVVITHALWQSSFDGSTSVIGTTMHLDGEPFTIVGVLPDSFRFAEGDAQLYIPLTFTARERSDAARHRDWYHMIGRLAPGSTAESVGDEIDALNRARLATYPAALRNEITEAGFHTIVQPYLSDLTRSVRTPLMLLWMGVMLVLAIGAANVAGLLLVRAQSRNAEVALRLSLGAAQSRVIRQLATEGALLGVMGCVVGLFAAAWSLRFLGAFDIYGIPRLQDATVGPLVVLLSVGMAVLLGAVAGASPAVSLVRSGGGSFFDRIRGNGRSSSLQQILVAGQIALAFVLVISTGLLVTSLRKLNAVDPGFDTVGVAVAVVSLPESGYPDEATRLSVTRNILESVAGLPMVREVAVADRLPFSGGNRVPVMPADDGLASGEAAGVPLQTVVSPGYFEALSISPLSGRGFRDSDDQTTARVAVIDEVLARRYWPEQDAVGQQLWRGQPGEARDPDKAITVVGVVESVRHSSLREEEEIGAFYVPLAQVPLGYFRLILRHDATSPAIWPAVRDRMAALDPGLGVSSTTTLEEMVAASLVLQRTPTQLLSIVSLLGLFLGAIGVYGVMAYGVTLRRREIAVRVAIGSTKRQIALLFGRECFTVVGAGLVIGLLGTLASSRLIASLLYDTELLNPATLAAALIAIGTAAAAACYFPLRRALRVDPASVLKSE
ncbi:MAG TPA: ABC transporter permease [Gemmatimonadaceae bacterium]|nr:ABC transporter permease [Gemmatimonadaceae bacterium]